MKNLVAHATSPRSSTAGLVSLCLVSVLLLVISCPNPAGGTPSEGDTTDDTTTTTGGPAIDKFFWGSWVRMDGSNAEWYVASDGVSISGAIRTAVASPDTSGFIFNSSAIAKQTDNLLKVTPSNSTVLPYFLFRKSGATADVRLGINSNAGVAGSVSRALSGIAGIKVLLQNAGNPGDTIEGTTTTAGLLVVPDVIAGDTYTVTVPTQPGVATAVTAAVTPVFDGQNLGFVTIGTAAQNFKVSYAISGNPVYLYAGQSYTLNLQIKNIGTEDMLSADYFITQPSGMTLTGSLQNILGTVQANGGEKVLNLTMVVPDFTEVEKSIEVPVRIKAIDGTEWNDAVSLKFYREDITIYVKSATNNVQGVVISPDRRSTPFVTSGYSGSITLPFRDAPYILALSGAGYNSETKYAVSTGVAPITNGSELTTSSINEPNNNETQTTSLSNGETQLGYLGVYDLDFYMVLGSARIPSTLVFADGDTVSKMLGSGTYINTASGVGTGTITYTSSMPGTASVNASTGEVTPAALGNTVITAVKTATATHTAAIATYALTVTLPAPTDVTAARGNGQVVVTWTAVTGATGYKVFYKAGTIATILDTQVPASMISGTTATIMELINDTQYAFVVVSTNEYGNSSASNIVNATPLLYYIGAIGQAGGRVFYDKGSVSDGWRYMEAASTDFGGGATQWGGTGIFVGGTETAIGTGKANTAAIVARLGAGTYAAKACDDYVEGGFNDWFLPSKEELNQMYMNIKVVDPVSFANVWYWSSLEFTDGCDGTGGAWGQNFSNYGQQAALEKFTNYYVRPVRAF